MNTHTYSYKRRQKDYVAFLFWNMALKERNGNHNKYLFRIIFLILERKGERKMQD